MRLLLQQLVRGERNPIEVFFWWGIIGLNIFTFIAQNVFSSFAYIIRPDISSAVIGVVVVIEVYFIWLLSYARSIRRTSIATQMLRKPNIKLFYWLLELAIYVTLIPILSFLAVIAIFSAWHASGLGYDHYPYSSYHIVFWTQKFWLR